MATARTHITAALQTALIIPVGVSPSTTDDEPDCLRELNNMVNLITTKRRRANQLVIEKLAEILKLAALAASMSLTGSTAQSALESIVAAAVAGVTVSPPTALATFATITTDNTYADVGMDLAIQKNLAVILCSLYKRAIPPGLPEEAATALLDVVPEAPKAA